MKKFRAWAKHQNKMYYPGELSADGMTLDMNGRGLVNISGVSNRLNQYDDNRNFIAEQYTGYFNAYQNDIAIVSDDEPYSSEQFTTGYNWTFEGIVKQIDGSWCVINADGESIIFSEIINSDMKLDIIGNIHEADK